MRLPGFSQSAAARAAIVSAAGFGVVAAFQLALALGVPWGRAAWGGNHDVLPAGLRAASVVSMLVFIGAALIVLGRAGYWGSANARVFRIAAWALVGLMTIGAIMNLASRSSAERLIWSPVALVLALSTFVVARSRRDR